MSFQRMDADTAETVAGVVRLLRRAAELVWAAVDTEGAGRMSQDFEDATRVSRHRNTEREPCFDAIS